jgi:hypothetical protein
MKNIPQALRMLMDEANEAEKKQAEQQKIECPIVLAESKKKEEQQKVV